MVRGYFRGRGFRGRVANVWGVGHVNNGRGVGRGGPHSRGWRNRFGVHHFGRRGGRGWGNQGEILI